MLKCIAIDDEFSCNALINDYCEKIPFIDLVATFTDPLLALPLLKPGELDLVFLDFYMNKMDAPAFLSYVPPSVQVIIISAEFLSRIEEYEMKVTAIISKPFSFERFLAVVTAINKVRKK
ncbi:LytR/AlgR family response regulator transcription factor [Mucilaginibacter sp.]